MTQLVSVGRELVPIAEKIGVVIPVYGESESVLWVLNRFPRGIVDTICLVVDVPVRRVMNRIRGAAEQSGITTHIIKNRQRRGIGLYYSRT